MSKTDQSQFERLVNIMKALRAPNGCPWDREQTHESLTPYAIEEVYELVEAVENGDEKHIKEELGDLLFQVVFHAQVAADHGNFSIDDVVKGIADKLEYRHPHVFAKTKVNGSEDVVKNWQELKKSEKKEVFAIPPQLPALQKAQKIGEKTRHLKFDWENPQEVLAKVEEELVELKDAMKNNDKNHQAHEIGDLLFSVVQLARHLKIDGEQALRKTNSRFEFRYKTMMKLAQQEGEENFEALTQKQKDVYWEKAKLEEKKLRQSDK